MNVMPGSTAGPRFDEAALKRGVASIRHPLTRALLALTFATGLIDAVSYLGLGRVFTANMTGNVVLLGFGLARSSGLPVLAPLLSLGCFVLGSGAGGVLVRRFNDQHPRLLSTALGLEVLGLVLAVVLAVVAEIRPGNGAAYVLIALLASAMGLRNAVVRRIAVPDLTTTVLTMTLTGLAADSRLAGGNGEGSVRRLTAVMSMLLGALTGALLLKASPALPLGLAGALALLTGVSYVPAAVRLGASHEVS